MTDKPEQFQLKWKAVAVVMIMVCASVLMTAYAIGTGTGGNSIPVVIESGSGVETASYIIYKDGDYTCAKNGTTARIDYRSENASETIQNALDDHYKSNIYISSGNYKIEYPIYGRTLTTIEFDNGATLIYDDEEAALIYTAPIRGGVQQFKTINARIISPNGTGISVVNGYLFDLNVGSIHAKFGIDIDSSNTGSVHCRDVRGSSYISSQSYGVRLGNTDETNNIVVTGDIKSFNPGAAVIVGNGSAPTIACENLIFDSMDIAANSVAYDVHNAKSLVIKNNYFETNNKNIYLNGTSGNLISGVSITDCFFVPSSAKTIDAKYTDALEIQRCRSYGPIYLGLGITNCALDTDGATNLAIDSSADVTFTGTNAVGRGTGIITPGNVTIVVNHGLFTTPGTIMITPRANVAGQHYWIDAVNSTTFKIKLAGTMASNFQFYWIAWVRA